MEGNEKKKNGLGRVFHIAGDILFFALITFVLFTLIVSIASRKDGDDAATVFGHQLRFVRSDSMAKCDLTDVSGYKIKSIPVKSCVFIEVIPQDEAKKEEWLSSVRVGDVLTFKYVYTKQETITHRVVEIEKKEGGYIITLEGDNKSSESGVMQQVIDTSQTDSPNYIIGRVCGKSYVLGLLVYAFRSPVGIVCLIIIPCVIIIIMQVLRLVRVFGAEKKETTETAKDKENEIEDLKRQIELLKQSVKSEAAENETAEPLQAEEPIRQAPPDSGNGGKSAENGQSDDR